MKQNKNHIIYVKLIHIIFVQKLLRLLLGKNFSE